MAEPPKQKIELPTEEELQELSPYAQVAYATRSALRVLPLSKDSDSVSFYNSLMLCSLYSMGSTFSESDLKITVSLNKSKKTEGVSTATKSSIAAALAVANGSKAYSFATSSSYAAEASYFGELVGKLKFKKEFRSDYEDLSKRYKNTDRPIDPDFFSKPLWINLDESILSKIEQVVGEWIETIQAQHELTFPIHYWHLFDSRRHGEIPWHEIEGEVRGWLSELEAENPDDDPEMKGTDQENFEIGRKISGAGTMYDTHNLHGAAVSLGGQMSNEDLLGRERLVDSIAAMIASPGQDTPFTIGLLGDWGSGKSNVMFLLRKTLAERTDSKRFYFADFNAWEYEHTDNMAAGVAQEVLKGLLGKKNFWQQLWIRIRFGKRENGLFMPVLGVILMLVAIGTFVMAITQQTGGWIAAFIATGSTLTLFFRQILTIIEHPLTAKINSYLKLPKYADYLGTIPILKRHLKTLCDLVIPPGTEKPNRLIVFVDDLDRCEPHAISRTLDAIRLVMDIENVVIIIGIDHRIAFRAVEKQYVDLADDERTSADIARDYLGKIIQLPVMLNHPGEDELQNFISQKLFRDVKDVIRNDSGDFKRIPGDTFDHESDDAAEPEKTTKDITSGEGAEKSGDSVETGAESVLNQTKIKGSKGPNTQPVQSKSDEWAEMSDTQEEKKYFTEMCTLFGLHNPRQLIRLRNCYRLLKRIERPNEEEWRPQMMLLFWLEFLYALQQQDRLEIENCFYNRDPDNLKNILHKKGFDQKLSETVVFKLNLQKEDFSFYERIVEEVKRLVLPHSESAKRAREESEAPAAEKLRDQDTIPVSRPEV
jgi:hypothetical protein